MGLPKGKRYQVVKYSSAVCHLTLETRRLRFGLPPFSAMHPLWSLSHGTGVVQEDCRTSEGVVHGLQFPRQVKRHGNSRIPTAWRCCGCSKEIPWKDCGRSYVPVFESSYSLLMVYVGRPIRIEIMVDNIPSSTTSSTLTPSLLSRIEHSPADAIFPVGPKRKSTS